MKNHARETARIGYTPYVSKDNAYVEQNQRILAHFGTVSKIPSFRKILKNPLILTRNRFDVIIINWLENTITSSRTGKFSPTGLIAFLAKITILRILSNKIVFVRHNNYPHHTDSRSGKKVTRLLDLIEYLFTICITHSGHNATSRRLYVPHPLYNNQGLSNKSSTTKKKESYYVAFGRILAYKNLVALARHFPADKRLIIAGPCADDGCLEELKQASAGKNIELRIGFLEKKEAEQLIANSCGLIIAHSRADMIVSGSFFFAIGLGVPVHAIGTPFFYWVKRVLNSTGLYVYDDLQNLHDGLNSSEANEDRIAVRDFAERSFGDRAVSRYWQKVFEKIDVAVDNPLRRSEALASPKRLDLRNCATLQE